jgi:hypothetical protein
MFICNFARIKILCTDAHLLWRRMLCLPEVSLSRGFLKGPWHEIFDLWFFSSNNFVRVPLSLSNDEQPEMYLLYCIEPSLWHDVDFDSATWYSTHTCSTQQRCNCENGGNVWSFNFKCMRPTHMWRTRTPAGVRCAYLPSVITIIMDQKQQLLKPLNQRELCTT